MKNGICPKCQGNNVYTNRDKTGKHLHYGDRGNIQVPKFGLRCLGTEIYICKDCRYFEEYVWDELDLDRAFREWTRV